MSFAKLFQFIMLLIIGVPLSAQTIFDDWRIRHPNPPANALNTAIYAEGRFVAAGYHATVVTSATGTVWETRFLEPGFDAQGLVYGEGKYVMIDRGGYVATSENLDAWYLQTIRASSLEDVIYANGMFVTIGRISRVFASDDGQDWTEYSVSDESWHLEGIAYGNGYYVIVARGGKIFRSTDLDSWTEVFVGYEGTENQTNNWEGMAFFDEKFIAYGPSERLLISSDNGVNWTEVPLDYDSRMNSHAEWNDELWISGHSDAIIHSSDGLTWERFATGIDVSLGAIAASPDRILALDDSSGVLASDNGETWTALLDNDIADFRSIAYRDGHYVAMADGDRLLHSTDGVNWTETLDVSATTTNYDGVAVVGDRFVVVSGRGEIAWSTDGMTWNTDTYIEFTGIVRELSVANGLLFAGCDGGILAYTSDGINWTEQDTGAGSGYGSRIEQVSFFNETYFAAGGNGTLASSTNLEDWTLHPLGTTAVMEKLLYYNGRYILFPTTGSRVLFSDDLITWTDDRTDPVIRTGGAWIFDGRIVVASNTGLVYTSEDGDTFLEHALPASTFREIVFDGEQYVAVGPAGVIATTGSESLSLLNLTIEGDGQVTRSPDQALYDPSTVIRLTAEPSENQQFLWWETTDGPVFGATLDISLDTDTNLTAVFAGLNPPSLNFVSDAGSWRLEWLDDPAWVLHESADILDWVPVSNVEKDGDDSRLENQNYSSTSRVFRFQLRSP